MCVQACSCTRVRLSVSEWRSWPCMELSQVLLGALAQHRTPFSEVSWDPVTTFLGSEEMAARLHPSLCLVVPVLGFAVTSAS